MKRTNIITFILLLGSTSLLYAHDFTVTGKSGEKFFFNIVDAKKQHVNPEKPDVPLNKNDAFQKVQKRRVQEKR